LIDIKQIAQYAQPYTQQIAAEYAPGGHIEAGEYVSLNPTRSDKSKGSFRININSGRWADYAVSGVAGGDIISYVAYITNQSQFNAAKEIADRLNINTEPDKPVGEWELLYPAPRNAPPPPKELMRKDGDKWIKYPVTHIYEYKSKQGELYGYVARANDNHGGKLTPTLTLWKRGDRLQWRQKGFPVPRPLYNGHLLTICPNAQVVIVEGEKCAEVLQHLIDESPAAGQIIAVSWPMGGKGVSRADWQPLKDRKILLWPDFDLQCHPETGEVFPGEKQPGYKTMIEVAGILKSNNPEIRFLYPVDGKPASWDVADGILVDGMGITDVIKFIKDNSGPIPENVKPVKVDLPKAPAPVTTPPPPVEQKQNQRTEYFKYLGHTGDHYYYLPKGTKRIKQIKGENHSKAFLLTLAPPQFWEREFPGNKGADYTMAASTLMRKNEQVGIFNADRMRGRGAWYDNGRAVLHLGDVLDVDGVKMSVSDIDSKYVYESGSSLDENIKNPLTAQSAQQLYRISNMLFWEKPIYSLYYAGWCMIAPVCGAMKHRPHIWVTGGAGTGKSFVMDNILKRCLGEFSLFVQSATTAAGLRQTLARDALPVLFDEFEGNDSAAQSRVQQVLELARQAFSDTDAQILKGTQSGQSMRFKIRSCFCMSSIAVNIAEHSDETRVAVLSLSKPHDTSEMTAGEHFKKLSDMVNNIITDEWCAGLRARAIKMIPVIRKNAETFASVIADRTGSRRAGDQIGPLMAGAYALQKDGVISIADATDWAEKQDWSEQRSKSDESDEIKCLNIILDSTIKTGNGAEEKTISELLRKYKDICIEGMGQRGSRESMEGDTVEDILLKRAGIRYDHDDALVYIADSSGHLKNAFRDSPHYSRSSGRILRRLSGSILKNSIRFSGNPKKATGIPWDVVFQL